MSSRKQEKEARREERLRAEQAAASEERRKKLLTGVGAAALAAVIVVVALVVISQSGGDDPGDGNVAGKADIDNLLAGIPQSGTVLGDPKAKVTVTEFGDLQCPACQAFSEQALPDIINGPIADGDANMDFKNFTIIGPDSTVAAKAALAASEQDRYWQYVELFYKNQGAENSGYVTDAFLTDIAKGAGVEDIDAWDQARNDPKWDQVLNDTQTEATSLGFQSTPSFLIDGPAGQNPIGSIGSVSDLTDAIQKAQG